MRFLVAVASPLTEDALIRVEDALLFLVTEPRVALTSLTEVRRLDSKARALVILRDAFRDANERSG